MIAGDAAVGSVNSVGSRLAFSYIVFVMLSLTTLQISHGHCLFWINTKSIRTDETPWTGEIETSSAMESRADKRGDWGWYGRGRTPTPPSPSSGSAFGFRSSGGGGGVDIYQDHRQSAPRIKTATTTDGDAANELQPAVEARVRTFPLGIVELNQND